MHSRRRAFFRVTPALQASLMMAPLRSYRWSPQGLAVGSSHDGTLPFSGHAILRIRDGPVMAADAKGSYGTWRRVKILPRNCTVWTSLARTMLGLIRTTSPCLDSSFSAWSDNFPAIAAIGSKEW